jgi:lactate 2-monooxygenase
MSAEAFAYTAGGAGVETTMGANRAAFQNWRIVPRQLTGAEPRALGRVLLGRRLPTPLWLAPVGVLELAHRDADLAVARAAAREGVPFVFSNQASVSMERCAETMERTQPGAPRYFQLYWSTSDDLVRSFVRRAEACGCGAIVLTVDTTLLGWRPRDLDLASLPFLEGKGIAQYTSDPVFLDEMRTAGTAPSPAPPLGLKTLRTALRQGRAFPGGTLDALRSGDARAAVQRFVSTYSRPTLAWDDLKLLRDATDLPILLKGILHPEDAARAVEEGVQGVVVSNHGGRQVDGAVAALDALPAVVEAVEGNVSVWFDSGVRGGADVFKALALGAEAVGVGRPYVYGLAVGGEGGVRETIRNVVAELDLTLALAGVQSVDDLGPGALAESVAPDA